MNPIRSTYRRPFVGKYPPADPVRGNQWALVADYNGSSLTGLNTVAGTWTTDGTAIRSNGINSSWSALRVTASGLTAQAMSFEFNLLNAPSTSFYRLVAMVTQADTSTANGNEVRVGYDASNVWLTQINRHGGALSYSASHAVLTAGVWYRFSWLTRNGILQEWKLGPPGGVFETFSYNGSASTDATKSNMYMGTYYADVQFRNIKAWTTSDTSGVASVNPDGW